MPTIFRTRHGYTVRIYPNDPRPSHVHVVGPETEARFELLCDQRAVWLMDNYGFSRTQLNTIAQELIDRLVDLCAAWEVIHE